MNKKLSSLDISCLIDKYSAHYFPNNLYIHLLFIFYFRNIINHYYKYHQVNVKNLLRFRMLFIFIDQLRHLIIPIKQMALPLSYVHLLILYYFAVSLIIEHVYVPL